MKVSILLLLLLIPLTTAAVSIIGEDTGRIINLQSSTAFGNGNESWNEAYADTLYADIIWGYNQTQAGTAADFTNVAYLNNTQTFTEVNTFQNILQVGGNITLNGDMGNRIEFWDDPGTDEGIKIYAGGVEIMKFRESVKDTFNINPSMAYAFVFSLSNYTEERVLYLDTTQQSFDVNTNLNVTGNIFSTSPIKILEGINLKGLSGRNVTWDEQLFNQTGGNITSEWIFANINHSYIQNNPYDYNMSDGYLSEFDYNMTDGFEADTDTNFTNGGTMFGNLNVTGNLVINSSVIQEYNGTCFNTYVGGTLVMSIGCG